MILKKIWVTILHDSNVQILNDLMKNWFGILFYFQNNTETLIMGDMKKSFISSY